MPGVPILGMIYALVVAKKGPKLKTAQGGVVS